MSDRLNFPDSDDPDNVIIVEIGEGELRFRQSNYLGGIAFTLAELLNIVTWAWKRREMLNG